MALRQYEWRKMLFYQKGIFIILLYLLFRIITLFIFDRPEKEAVFVNKTAYEEWLSPVEGGLDENKKKYFEFLNKRYTEAEKKIQTIHEDLANGAIPREDYNHYIRETEAFLNKKDGFQALYEQYLYVREKDNRYLLSTNAWNGILAQDKLNIPLIFVVAAITINVFNGEQKTEMDCFLRTTRGGRKQIAHIKLQNLLWLTVLLVFSDFIIHFLFLDRKYGFTHGNYPLQSLEYFKDCIRGISLQKAMVFKIIIRMIGYVYVSAITGAAVMVTGKSASAIFIVLSSLLIPYYGFPYDMLKYYMPGPLGMLMGAGYFKGSVYEANPYTGRGEMIFKEFSNLQILLLLGAGLITIRLIWNWITKRYSNAWEKKRAGKGWLLVFLLCGMLTGCSNRLEKIPGAYNLDNRLNYENDSYIFYISYEDINNPAICCMDKKSGEQVKVIRDVFSGSRELAPFFYVKNASLYYMYWTYDEEERVMARKYSEFRIACIDTNTFDSQIVYSDNANISPQFPMGFGRYENPDADFYKAVTAFYVEKGNILLVTSDAVWSLNIITKRKEKMLDYKAGNLAYTGDKIVYLDDLSRLNEYDIRSGEASRYDNVFAKDFYVQGKRAAYSDKLDGNKLYGLDLETGNRELLSERIPLSIAGDNEYIYFTDEQTNALYQLNPRTKEESVLTEHANFFYCFVSYGKVYVIDSDNRILPVDKQY